MTAHHRNEDGTLGVAGIPGHYTCEGQVRRLRHLFRRVQCHAPATHAEDYVMRPEGVTITFRYCASCAPRSITPTTTEASP